MKKFVLGFAVFLLAGAIYLYNYLGFYKPVELSIEKRGPLILLYKQHMGPYHKILSVIQEAEKWTREHNLPCSKTFGEFLDNPETMDEDRLRSHAGCVLSTPLDTPPPEFIYQVRPERTYAIARFSGSPAIGPLTVYPKLKEFMEERRVKSSAPVIEMYTVNGNEVTTEYLFAVDNPPPVTK